jgi:Yip1 domain
MKTVIDIIVAPKDAFESLRENPVWGWTLLATVVLMIIGYFLQLPATEHASYGTMQHALATSSLYSTMTDEQKARVLARVAHPPAYQAALGIASIVIVLFVAALLNAAILLAGSALARGSGDFKHLFAGSMAITVPSFGLYSLVLGIILRVLGPDHFATIADIYRAVPGLALLVSGASGKLAAFLAGIQIFSLWGCGLNIVMMQVLAGVRNAVAWLVPLLILIGAALLQAGTSGLYGG